MKALSKIIATVLCLSMTGTTACSGKETPLVSAAPESTAEQTTDTAGGSETTAPSAPVLDTDNKSTVNTGSLSCTGNGYEGTKGSGKFNYGEALQKSLLFYELQRSGDLPDETRCNWRGDSALSDGSDNGLNLSGGLYDAGDHVKFNLPMAYTSSVLAWSVYEDSASYTEAGQLDYVLGDIKWITDYLIKCHPEDKVFYYQVGDGGADHSWWGPAEIVDKKTTRPSYKVTIDAPGATVTAEAAAALASASVIFENVDKEYSSQCLLHAKILFDFAAEKPEDTGYTAANGFYTSNSGPMDELSWAAIWLYNKTGEKQYLDLAESFFDKANSDYNWAMCWDDVHIGTAVLLAKATGNEKYTKVVEKHLDYWTTGTDNGEKITYTPKGLAWLDQWGSLRYATTTAFVAAVYSSWDKCPEKKKNTYWDFAVSQADYALGSTGRSFLIGFGEDYPKHPHHRTAQGSFTNNMNDPADSMHTLYGALVGGPDSSDNYTDEVSNYTTNEVACDYNAGFTGLLAKLYGKYKGETLKDFGAVEETGSEYEADTSINVQGEDFLEIKSFIMNKTAWPARASTSLEYRYYVDLSEVYAEGKSVSDIKISTNFMKSGTVDGLKEYNKDKHIYYLSVNFNDGKLMPGSQDDYRSEIQVRMQNPGGAWNNDNDPSFKDMNGCLYENGELVYGTEPDLTKTVSTETTTSATATTESQTDGSENTTATTETTAGSSAAQAGKAELKIRYDGTNATSNSISGSMEIVNKTGSEFNVKDLNVFYYITNNTKGSLVFDCYYSAVNETNGQNTGMNGVSGSFSETKGNEADTEVKISFSEDRKVPKGATVVVNFSIHYNDWKQMSPKDDRSFNDKNNIVVTLKGETLCGIKP